MKRIVLALIAFCSLSLFTPPAQSEEQGGGAEKTLLVKVMDHAERVTYELMSQADFQQLQKQIAAEAKFHVKALDAAEKEWKADEGTKKKSFPKNAVSVRKAQSVREFTDASKASDALTSEEAKISDKEQADKDKQTEKEKALIEKKLKTKEQIEKQKKKDNEKDNLSDAARNLYEAKLQEIMGQGEGGGEQAKEEPKDNDKKAK